MSYTDDEFKKYKSNPKKISADLDFDLLLALIDYDASNIQYVKPQSRDLIEAAYDIDPAVFQYVDFSKVTIQFIEKAIDQNPILIQHLRYPNDTVIKLALSRDLNVLPYIEKHLDNDMYEWLMTQNGLLLEFIPAAKQTEQLVMLALQNNTNSYEYAHVKTKQTDIYLIENDPTKVTWLGEYWPELIVSLIEYNPMFITKFYDMSGVVTEEHQRMAISSDPLVYLTIQEPSFEIQKHAVDTDVNMLSYMEYNQTLIDYAISTNGLALKYVKKKDLQTIRNAISQNALSLEFVDYPRQYMIDFAFKKDPMALKYVENPTSDQCIDAVKRNPYAIEFVPIVPLTKELQLRALMAGPDVIPILGPPQDEEVLLQMIRLQPSYIFKIEEPTEKMYRAAFTTEGQMIYFFDNWQDFFSTEIIGVALGQDGTIFEHVKYKTRYLAMLAIEQYPPALQWVTFQDAEMIKFAIKIDPRVIFFADRDELTEDLLHLALELDPDWFTRSEGDMSWEEWLELTGQN